MHLVQVHSGSNCVFVVYEMKRDYSACFVKYQVNLSAVPNVFPEMIINKLVWFKIINNYTDGAKLKKENYSLCCQFN